MAFTYILGAILALVTSMAGTVAFGSTNTEAVHTAMIVFVVGLVGMLIVAMMDRQSRAKKPSE